MRRRIRTGAGFVGACGIGWAVAMPALAATPDSDSGLLAIGILVAIVLFVVGLGLRVWRSARMTPGWKAFIERRKAEGRSTRWAKWDDEENDKRGP